MTSALDIFAAWFLFASLAALALGRFIAAWPPVAVRISHNGVVRLASAAR